MNWFSKNKLNKEAPNKEQIKVMTIHTQGQESPIVILPDTLNHSIKMAQSKLVNQDSDFLQARKIGKVSKNIEIEKW